MKAFSYQRPETAEHAAAAAVRPGAKLIAGGTNLLDLMKLQVETPSRLVDINGLSLEKIEDTADGGLRIGTLVRNSDLAADRRVRQRYGVLSRALLAGASAQLRNKATTGGNLLQRTRCYYLTRPRPAAICCSEPAATISMTSQSPATSAAPAPAARRLRDSTAFTPSWVAASTASRRIRRIWRSRCGRSMPGWRRSTARAKPEAFRSRSSIACPAKLQRSRHRSSRVRSSPR